MDQFVVDRLRTSLRDRVTTPADAGYDAARATFNATVGRRPSVIVRVRTIKDVVAAVVAAGDLGLPIAVRGGGHSVAGHGMADGDGVALVVECGQHFNRASGELAVQVALDFIAHFGLIDSRPANRAVQQRFQLLQTCMVKTPQFRFVRPLIGFETFDEGQLIAVDGDDELRAPCDDCTVLMPTRAPVVGREAVYLSRPLPA